MSDGHKLQLHSYLTEVTGKCELRGMEQLYQRNRDTVAPPTSTEFARRTGIEASLLQEKASRRYNKSEPRPLNCRKRALPNGVPTLCNCEWCSVQPQFVGKKYKPVALKVKPILCDLPDKFRIQREIKGDPLKDMPPIPIRPVSNLLVDISEKEWK